MGADSHIEWTDHTFNGWIGCTKVDALCTHCYAETRDKRHLIEKVDHWGPGAPRLRTSEANWKLPLRWEREAAHAWAAAEANGILDTDFYTRPRVFCASLSDWLDDEVPIEWTADLLQLIRVTQHLDWQLLTKRPGNFAKRLQAVMMEYCKARAKATGEATDHLWCWLSGWLNGSAVPANVWIGTSVGTQKGAEERIPQLLTIPARVRFLSMEPLLEAVNISYWINEPDHCCGQCGAQIIRGRENDFAAEKRLLVTCVRGSSDRQGQISPRQRQSRHRRRS